MSKLGFIGLGVMGYPMAGHLSKTGHQVTVYNRTIEKAKKWINEFNGILSYSPKEAAINSDFIFICVGNDEDVLSVINGDNGILAGLNKGSILIDHTTASADLAKDLYNLAKNNEADFIDAPVSGGQAGAENGMLSIMCGGDENAFKKTTKIIKR